MKLKLASASLLLASCLPASTIQLVAAGPFNDGHDYVLPYTLSVDGHLYDAACYDFFDSGAIGQIWSANLLSVYQAAAQGKFSAVLNSLSKYQTIARLYSLAPDADKVNLQHAIWAVFDPEAFPITGEMAGLYARADALNVSGFDYSRYIFIENSSGVQTFVIDSGPAVAEPPTYVLFISLGLCGLILGAGLKAIRGT